MTSRRFDVLEGPDRPTNAEFEVFKYARELEARARQARHHDLREVKPPTKTGDTRFADALAKALQARDEDEDEASPENPEALRKRIRAEVIEELHERLVVSPTKPRPVGPQQAQFVRDPSLDPFFELTEAEKEIRRRRRGH
jgi:hypothetical protein